MNARKVTNRRIGPPHAHQAKPNRARTAVTSSVRPASLSATPASIA
jgi:hypothetical protein